MPRLQPALLYRTLPNCRRLNAASERGPTDRYPPPRAVPPRQLRSLGRRHTGPSCPCPRAGPGEQGGGRPTVAQGWTPARGCAQQGARGTAPWCSRGDADTRGWGALGGCGQGGTPRGHTWGLALCWQEVAEGTRALLGEAGGPWGVWLGPGRNREGAAEGTGLSGNTRSGLRGRRSCPAWDTHCGLSVPARLPSPPAPPPRRKRRHL